VVAICRIDPEDRGLTISVSCSLQGEGAHKGDAFGHGGPAARRLLELEPGHLQLALTRLYRTPPSIVRSMARAVPIRPGRRS
jgi:hypothetical protein